MDCTHDNESPRDRRTAQDALATGALVPLAWAAVGSNKGFDDIYGKHLDIVTDPRHYETSKAEEGIGRVKRLLNHLHTEMAINGYSEGHFSQEGDVRLLSLTRVFRRRCSDAQSFLCGATI
jgi:glycogen debranching enzyme